MATPTQPSAGDEKLLKLLDILGAEYEKSLEAITTSVNRINKRLAFTPPGFPEDAPLQARSAVGKQLLEGLQKAKLLEKRLNALEEVIGEREAKLTRAEWLCRQAAEKVVELQERFKEEKSRRKQAEKEKKELQKKEAASTERQKKELLSLLQSSSSPVVADGDDPTASGGLQSLDLTGLPSVDGLDAVLASGPQGESGSTKTEEDVMALNEALEKERSEKIVVKAEKLLESILQDHPVSSRAINDMLQLSVSGGAAPSSPIQVPTKVLSGSRDRVDYLRSQFDSPVHSPTGSPTQDALTKQQMRSRIVSMPPVARLDLTPPPATASPVKKRLI